MKTTGLRQKVKRASRSRSVQLATGLLVFLFSPTLMAVDCMNLIAGKIELTTQSQVTNFQTNHGPCDTVPGSLEISGAAITNLSGLSDLVSITGGLAIFDTILTNVDGLIGIQNVGGELDFERNANLVDVTGMSNLINLGDNFVILDNDNLSDCTAFARLLDDNDDGPPGPGVSLFSPPPDVGGFTTIESNLPGCNSVDEILHSAPLPMNNSDVPALNRNSLAILILLIVGLGLFYGHTRSDYMR